jgi:hypothetical protein
MGSTGCVWVSAVASLVEGNETSFAQKARISTDLTSCQSLDNIFTYLLTPWP